MADTVKDLGLTPRPLPEVPFNAITWGWTGIRGTWTDAISGFIDGGNGKARGKLGRTRVCGATGHR